MLQNMFGMLPFYVPWVLPNLQHKTYTAKAAIQGYSREMKISLYATQNTRNPYNLIFCLIRNKLAIQVAWRIRLIMTPSLD
jgi:hypothetical protein